MTAAVGADHLDAIIDLNSAIADGTALDKWKVTGAANYATSDGTHPSTVIHTAMAVIAAARFATYTP